MPPAVADNGSALLTVRLPLKLLRALNELTQAAAASDSLNPPNRNKLICQALADYVRAERGGSPQ